MDLLGEHLAEGAAEHGEVLAEDEDLAAVDRAPAGDDAVGVGPLEQAAVVGPVAGEHVELVERALVEQELDALAGEHLALGVLALDRPLRPGVERLLLALGQLGQPLAHRVLGHAGQGTAGPAERRKLDRPVKTATRSVRRLRPPCGRRRRHRSSGRRPMHELVIRGGTVVDGTGAPAATADVAVDGGRITAVGDGRRAGRAGARRRRPRRRARLGRHPHPLRRPGHLGPGGHPVELARRHHRRDGQLRRRLRAGAARRARTSSSS